MKYSVLILFITLFGSTKAQNWEPVGPKNLGGKVQSILIDNRDTSGRTLWAGTSSGLYKSQDNGESWFYESSLGCKNISVISQTSNGKLWVGTGLRNEKFFLLNKLNFSDIGQGLYYQNLNGDWFISSLSDSFDVYNSYIHSILNVKSDPNTILVSVQLNSNIKVFKSSNDGLDWTPVFSSPSYFLSLDQSELSQTYNGTYLGLAIKSNVIYLSGDTGTTWQQIDTAGIFRRNAITRLVSPSSDPGNFYVYSNGNSILRINPVTETITNFWSPVPLQTPYINQGSSYFGSLHFVGGDTSKFIIGSGSWFSSSQRGIPVDLTQNVTGFNLNSRLPYLYDITEDQSHHKIYLSTIHGIFKADLIQSTFPDLQFQFVSNGLDIATYRGFDVSSNGTLAGSNFDSDTWYSFWPDTAIQWFINEVGEVAISKLNPNVWYTISSNNVLKFRQINPNAVQSPFDTLIDPSQTGNPTFCTSPYYSGYNYFGRLELFETKTAWNTSDSILQFTNVSLSIGDSIDVRTPDNVIFKWKLLFPVTAGSTFKIPNPVKSRLAYPISCGLWIKKNALNPSLQNDWLYFPERTIHTKFSDNGNQLWVVSFTQPKIFIISHFNEAKFQSYNIIDIL